MANEYLEKLKYNSDQMAHLIFDLAVEFPKEEVYCTSSQIRRSALSVPLNIIEGYARIRTKVYINFLEIAFGSLKETEYLLKFSLDRGFIKNEDKYNEINKLINELGAMLWHSIKSLKE